ncbi:MAG: cyclic nucleotide-binding domain-containing protein [Gemmatimonadota bacterium]
METAARQIDPEWENFFSPEKAETKEPLDRALGRIPVFGLLKRRELRRLARLVHVRRFAAGETVIRRGAKQSGFYLIGSGSVNVVREHADGRREAVATLYPPELLGEFALLDDSPRSTSLVAAEASELIGFFKPDLMDIIATKPAMGCRILLRLAEDMTRSLGNDYRRLRDMGYPWTDGQGGDEGLDPTAA